MALAFESVSAETVYSNNSWNTIHTEQIPPGNTVSVEVEAMARRGNNGDCGKWKLSALFKREDTGPVALVGTVLSLISPIKTVGALLWDFRIRLDDDDYIYFDGKGASGNDVGWFIRGSVTSLNYPTE